MLKKISFLLILISILKTGFSQEQINYENPQEYEIAELKVSGIKYLDKSTLVQISGLQEGQKIMIPGDEITNAVKKFWEQKMFSDVSIRATKIEDGKIWLEVYLQERPRVSGVFYFGIKNSDKEELNTKLNLAKGKQINDDILVNSENIIKNYFSEKGFSRTSVLINQKTDTAFQNAVILNIYINKHKKTKIDNINLENVTVFTQLKFKRKLLKETKEKRFYGLFKPSKYIKTKYTEDKLKIIEEYNKLGYRDARIVRDSVFDGKEGNVNISINMYEGKQYFFRNISWIGNTIYPTEILNANLKIKKGDVYDELKLSDRLNMDEDAVGNLYMDNGYLFFNVTPVETKIEGDSVDIQLVMYEGQKARINNVIITGNDQELIM